DSAWRIGAGDDPGERQSDHSRANRFGADQQCGVEKYSVSVGVAVGGDVIVECEIAGKPRTRGPKATIDEHRQGKENQKCHHEGDQAHGEKGKVEAPHLKPDNPSTGSVTC